MHCLKKSIFLGEKTSEHSDDNFNMEDYLKYCEKHPADKIEDDSENEGEDLKKVEGEENSDEECLVTSEECKKIKEASKQASKKK